MRELTKSLKRKLSEQSLLAHEEELRRALLPLAEKFEQWRQAKVQSGELALIIRDSDRGPQTELFKKYNYGIKEMNVAYALVTASARRFRPIAMTALTTIIGMIPLTFAPPSRLGISYKSFGLTLIGGMTTATIFTLLVVPIFYTFFDDARLAFMRLLRHVFRNGRDVSSTPGDLGRPASEVPASSPVHSGHAPV